ncbi:RNA polymerase sigma factor [Sphingomonas sp. GlSt437]|uniref:RNA polymerase sigma factor n=1 Tax=Sphingomonas sp. GlSt437 TaxID=3389970 RepID=UPI003A89BEF1
MRPVREFPHKISEAGVAEPSIDDLFRRHVGWLRGFLARRLRAQPADIDDIVQDTYLRAARQPATVIVHPRAFLSQTATNVFRDGKRREAVRARHRESAIQAADNDGPAPGLAEQEALLELERLILAMPEIYRDVFALSRFRHMSNAEIAARLGISVKTVEWRMGKALAFCTSRLRS